MNSFIGILSSGNGLPILYLTHLSLISKIVTGLNIIGGNGSFLSSFKIHFSFTFGCFLLKKIIYLIPYVKTYSMELCTRYTQGYPPVL